MTTNQIINMISKISIHKGQKEEINTLTRIDIVVREETSAQIVKLVHKNICTSRKMMKRSNLLDIKITKINLRSKLSTITGKDKMIRSN